MENGKLDAVGHMIGMREGKGKNAPSHSWCYADFVKDDIDVCANIESEDIYRWKDGYWNQRSKNAEEAEALKVLSVADPKSYSTSLGKEMARALMLTARPLPKSNEYIIPMQGAYIHVDRTDFNAPKLVAKAPEREEGITYLVDTEFRGQIDGEYIPRTDFTGTVFGKFIEEVLPDAEQRELVRRYLGYTLIGDTRYQVFQVWIGDGSNGKSSLAKLAALAHRRVEAFEFGGDGQFTKENLIGASLILVDEAPKDKMVKAEELKKLISGEAIQINRKSKAQVTTVVKGKWLVNTNHIFRVNDDSDGFWRRMIPIEFDQKFEGTRKDANIDDKLAGELDVFIDWALGGLVDLMKEGGFTTLPQRTLELKDKFRCVNDPILQWIKDAEIYMSEAGDDDRDTPKRDVYEAFIVWCERNGRRSNPTSETFWNRVYKIFPEAKTREKQKTITRMGSKGRERVVPIMLDGMPEYKVPEPDFSEENVVPMRKIVNGRF